MYNEEFENGYESENNQTETQERHSRHRNQKAAALALCCALLGSAVGAGSVTLLSRTGSSSTTLLTGTKSTVSASAVTLSNVDTSQEMTASEIYEAYVNSTVGITTETSTNYFGYETTSAASGSGFIISSDGYIVTNYHVVEDSDSITVSTYDNTSYEATLVGYDESNDLAVLKIDASGLTPVVLGDSSNLRVGDEVIAIGNPLGELTFSLTSGVVSALNRSVTLTAASTSGSGTTMNLIQTDCAINSGNSGGALFNMYGEVIGITNAKYSGSTSSGTSIDNIGFAIPLNSVKNIITSIIEDGTVEKSYIGVSVSGMTTDAAANTGLTQGAVIQSVTDGGPADDAGLKTGDVVTAVDGKEITGSSDLVSVVSSVSDGDELVFTINRDGETLELTVTVGTQVSSALPDSSDDSGSSDSGSNPYSQMPGNGSNGYRGYGYDYDYGYGYGGSDGNSGSNSNGSSGSSSNGNIV